MKIELRWQLLLATVCIALLVSLFGFQIQSADLCITRVASAGRRLVEGRVGQPDHINPLLADRNTIDQELVDLVFDGLLRYSEEAGDYIPALAQDWDISEDGLIYSFELRDNVSWHDGQPLSVEDVAFTYGLLKDEEFPGSPTLQKLWQSVVISQTGESSIDFILPVPYSPFLDATTLGILPSHLLKDVPVADLVGHSFNQSPVGTGPFLVVPGNDWHQDGILRLSPNPDYWREGVRINAIDFRFYADGQSLADAFESGDIHAITEIPSDEIDNFGNLSNIRMFSSPASIFTQLMFNLSDTGAPGIRSIDVRRALTYGLDREMLVDEALSGQGLPLFGPYLPNSWAFNPDSFEHRPFQPDDAVTILESAGWVIPDGATIRVRDGQQLTLRILTDDDKRHLAIANGISKQWQIIGIETELISVRGSQLIQTLIDGEFDAAIVDVQPTTDPDLYDFWSQEALVSGQNYGAWNSRRASEALESARKLLSQEERKPFYNRFLQSFSEDLPALTLYQHVRTYAISDEINDVEIGRINSPRERYDSLREWYLTSHEGAVACPETHSET